MRRVIVAALLTCGAVFTAHDRAGAEGAIAEGIAPGGVVKGYEISVIVNRSSANVARTDSLSSCKKKPEKVASGAAPNNGNTKARERCAVVMTFSNKCAAVAVDPKDGTPGAGWGIGDTQKAADEEALARCKSVAGADRRSFCKLTSQNCDGKAE